MERFTRYMLKRFLVLVVGILVILTVEFCLFRVVPEDPVQWAVPTGSGFDPSDYSGWYVDWREHVIDMLDQPLHVQYLEFIGDMLTGDYGPSIVYRSDVSDGIYSAMLRTFVLFSVSLLSCLLLGSVAGRAISSMKSHPHRQGWSIVPLALFSLPVVAWQWFFSRYVSLEWGLLPAIGSGPLGSSGIDIEHSVLPCASVFLASIGAFILCIRDGQTRASAALSPKHLTLRDGMFAALPNIQFMVAASIVFVVCAEVWFNYPGLGYNFVQSLLSRDYFWQQASLFLLAILVFTANFTIETILTLARGRQRLDLFLREDEDLAADEVEACDPVAQPKVTFRTLGHATVLMAKDFFRSPVGVLAFTVFIVIVALAAVGPSLSSDEYVPFGMESWEDLFLDGASALVAISLLSGFIGLLGGMAIGVVAGYVRPYADGVVTGVMQGLIAIPFLGLVLFLWVTRSYRDSYDAALACSVPVMALVSLLTLHGFISSKDRVAAASKGVSRIVRFVYSAPAVFSWALGGLKYGISAVVTTVFVCDFLGLTYFSSWGYAFETGLRSSSLVTEWEYILPPFIGAALLIGSMFLILDTIERVIRTRFSKLM